MNKVKPMDVDERAHLLHIYSTRFFYWFASFTGLACLVYSVVYDVKIKDKELDYLTASQ
jgi:hypothetical protein